MEPRGLGGLAILAAIAFGLAACQTTASVEQQTQALTLSSQSLASRQLQTRRFDTDDETKILAACSGVLQDLGFIISESSSSAGLLVASKDRDAVESGQVAGQLLLALLAAVAGSSHNPTWDKEQTIVVTLITTPVKNSKQIETRVSFDRRLTNNRGQLWRAELITEAPIYQEFFDKLSKSTFLEAHIK